jgi:hypothetical protein
MHTGYIQPRWIGFPYAGSLSIAAQALVLPLFSSTRLQQATNVHDSNMPISFSSMYIWRHGAMEEAEEMGEKHVTGLKLTPHQLFFLFYKLRIIEPRAKKNPPMLHCQDWMNTLF